MIVSQLAILLTLSDLYFENNYFSGEKIVLKNKLYFYSKHMAYYETVPPVFPRCADCLALWSRSAVSFAVVYCF